MENSYFSSPERIDVFEPLGKKMRMGSPDELAISDSERFTAAVLAGNIALASEYLEIIKQANAAMVALMYQWSAHFASSLENHVDPERYDELLGQIIGHYEEAVSNLSECESSREAVLMMSSFFSPEILNPEATRNLVRQLQLGGHTVIDDILRPVVRLESFLERSLLEGDGERAISLFENYLTYCRTVHDCAVQYTDSFPTVLARQVSQKVAEAIIEESFRTAPFSAGMWELGAAMSPLQLAAFLLEHLRDHYGGAGRRRAARVVEHEDRYQLIFEPCGSGGALRRRRGDRQFKMESASPNTFGRSGEVPPYCTHCAMNAMTSIKKFGYPIYVTEFDPDPARPCGWTVYKDPDSIPEHFFSQVGYRKDPVKFRREYWKKD